MSIRWWYGAAMASLVWAVYLLLSQSTTLTSLLSTTIFGFGFRGLLFILWFLLPIFIVLDWRQIRDDTTWDLAVGPWVLISVIWLANIAVGAAYCLRRETALRNTVPAGWWVYGVIAGITFWFSLVLLNILPAETEIDIVKTSMSGPLALTTLIGSPMSLYLDIEHVRGHTYWDPSTRFWLIGSIVPFVNIFVGSAYLVRRYVEFEETSDPTSVKLLNVGARQILPVPSPWYRRISFSTFVYFLLVIVLSGTPDLFAINLWQLAAILWIPFGLVISSMIYFDIRNLLDYGVQWGTTRYIYLSSFLFPFVAFLYLLRRSTKSQEFTR